MCCWLENTPFLAIPEALQHTLPIGILEQCNQCLSRSLRLQTLWGVVDYSNPYRLASRWVKGIDLPILETNEEFASLDRHTGRTDIALVDLHHVD